MSADGCRLNLREQLGPIDIYLLDQVMKDRLVPGMSLLDAGCGGGRNLVYFLRNGFQVFGVDEHPESVSQVRELAAQLAPDLPSSNFQVYDVAEIAFPDESFDAVVCSAVLHFARDEAHFDRMLDAMWRVLKPGGLFFARLASTIGLEGRVTPIQGRWYHLPDGSDRFLVDDAMLTRASARLGARWADPLKTTLVQNQRSMSTWVLWKS